MGGLGLSFVSGNGLDFANYLAEFFTANSRRATGDWDPGDDDGGADTGAADDGGNTDAGDGTAPGTDGGGDSDGGAGTDGDGGDAGDAEDDGGAASVATFGQDDGRIEPSGCQCNADERGTGGLAGLGLGLIAVWRRRRARG
jgi:MYXO-CTERM domain-containing protein